MLILDQPPIVYSPEVQQFLDRTPKFNSAQRKAYVTLITSLVNRNIWGKLDALYLFATVSEPVAVLNVVSSKYTCTIHNGPAFDPGWGFTGTEAQVSIDNATPVPYLDTNFNPVAAATVGDNPKFTQNNAHFSVWNMSNFPSTILGGAFLGARDGLPMVQLRMAVYDPGPPIDASASWCSINDSAFYRLSRSSDWIHGFRCATRANANFMFFYEAFAGYAPQGSAQSSPTPSLINLSLYILARNSSGTANVGTPNQIGMVSIGAGLTTVAEVNFFHLIIRTFLSDMRSTLGIVPAMPPQWGV